ncbi:MAG: hypothetical protein QGI75_01050 [Phycisphaerales bacterium]|jgi:hypothetical protein|nr:hypothetical protein [Phycisphaerales bacterium]
MHTPLPTLVAISDTLLILLGLVLLVLFGFAAYYAHQKAQKRIAAMRAFASELGLRFALGDDHTHDEQFAQFAVFCRGTRRIAYNTMSGSAMVGPFTQSVMMGDFRYTVQSGSGKNRHSVTKRFSYVLVAMPHPEVPELLLREEHFFDRITDFFGFDDIDFESAEFSRRFHVASSHKRFAWDLIDPQMMEFLMAEESPVIDMEAGWMCVADEQEWSVDAFRARLDFIARFLDHWPDHVVRGLSEGRYRELD